MARFASGPSRAGQQLADDIRNARTPYARRRAFTDNLVKTLAIAGLTGAAGVSKHMESSELQMKQDAERKDAEVKAAIRNAKLPPSHPDDTPRDEYGLEVQHPGYSPTNAGRMDNTVRMGMPKPDVTQTAKNTLAGMDANDAATSAPVAGRWTEKGFGEADQNAGVQASDIQMARNLMEEGKMKQAPGFGGLQNSFAGGY